MSNGYWPIVLDGLDINDGVNYLSAIPELGTDFGSEVLLTDMQAAYPVFNRQQPLPGRYTLLVHILHPTWANFEARKNAFQARCGPGPRVLAAQGRGMPALQSVTVFIDGGVPIVDAVTGRVTTKAVAPNPTWS